MHNLGSGDNVEGQGAKDDDVKCILERKSNIGETPRSKSLKSSDARPTKPTHSWSSLITPPVSPSSLVVFRQTVASGGQLLVNKGIFEVLTS